LHYNWHRHYDASLGRYTQPDPLGFVDGPSVFGYARSRPYRYVDKDGRLVWTLPAIVGLIRYLVLPSAIRTLPAVVTSAILGGSNATDDQQSQGTDADGQPTNTKTVTVPPRPKRGWTCNCRVDCNDNIPGNCPDKNGKKFALGSGQGKQLDDAKNACTSDAQRRLQCQTKHDQCRCISSGGDYHRGGC
jgi:uncharacterized protein RhaS with RHS repeats